MSNNNEISNFDLNAHNIEQSTKLLADKTRAQLKVQAQKSLNVIDSALCDLYINSDAPEIYSHVELIRKYLEC